MHSTSRPRWRRTRQEGSAAAAVSSNSYQGIACPPYGLGRRRPGGWPGRETGRGHQHRNATPARRSRSHPAWPQRAFTTLP